MSPSFSTKNSVRYRFYVSSALLRGRKGTAGTVARVSAPEIESFVFNALRHKLQLCGDELDYGLHKLIEQNIASIALRSRDVLISLRSRDGNNPETIKLPWSPREKHGLAMIDEHGTPTGHRQPNPRLVQAITRAHVWLRSLSNGTFDSIEALASAANLHPKVVRRAVRLAFLAPSLTNAILNGDQPSHLVVRDANDLEALSWAQQRSAIHRSNGQIA